jgi:hypothetical protein
MEHQMSNEYLPLLAELNDSELIPADTSNNQANIQVITPPTLPPEILTSLAFILCFYIVRDFSDLEINQTLLQNRLRQRINAFNPIFQQITEQPPLPLNSILILCRWLEDQASPIIQQMEQSLPEDNPALRQAFNSKKQALINNWNHLHQIIINERNKVENAIASKTEKLCISSLASMILGLISSLATPSNTATSIIGSIFFTLGMLGIFTSLIRYGYGLSHINKHGPYNAPQNALAIANRSISEQTLAPLAAPPI